VFQQSAGNGQGFLTRHQFHNPMARVAGLFEALNGNDLGEPFGFALKPRQPFGVAGKLLGQNFVATSRPSLVSCA
jgi:hypothetical protein